MAPPSADGTSCIIEKTEIKKKRLGMTYAEELLFVMPVIAIAMAAMGTIVGTGVLCCPGENQVQRPMTKFHNFVIHTRLMVVTLLLMLLVLWINLIVVEGCCCCCCS